SARSIAQTTTSGKVGVCMREAARKRSITQGLIALVVFAAVALGTAAIARAEGGHANRANAGEDEAIAAGADVNGEANANVNAKANVNSRDANANANENANANGGAAATNNANANGGVGHTPVKIGRASCRERV